MKCFEMCSIGLSLLSAAFYPYHRAIKIVLLLLFTCSMIRSTFYSCRYLWSVGSSACVILCDLGAQILVLLGIQDSAFMSGYQIHTVNLVGVQDSAIIKYDSISRTSSILYCPTVRRMSFLHVDFTTVSESFFTRAINEVWLQKILFLQCKSVVSIRTCHSVACNVAGLLPVVV